MAVTANIAPNISAIQSDNFSFTITFAPPVGVNVDLTTFSLDNLVVSGSDHVTIANFRLGESQVDNMVVITCLLPSQVSGSFTLNLMGEVTVGSQSETITAAAKTIQYNTLIEITAGFGALTHHGHPVDFQIDVLIAFGEDISRFTRTDCELERVTGSEIFGMCTSLTGMDRDFKLALFPEEGTVGVLELGIEGAATRGVTDRILEVDVTPVLVPFNARVPQIIDIDAPPVLEAGTYDILWTLDHPDVGLDGDGLIYEGDVEGVDFETDPPAIYQARTLDVKPALPPAPTNPEDLPAYIDNWELRRPNFNRVPSQFLLIRFNMPEGVSGQFSVNPKPDAFRPTTP